MTRDELEEKILALENAMNEPCNFHWEVEPKQEAVAEARDAILAAFSTLTAERDALKAELDQRWRAMDTAPKDGTDIHGLLDGEVLTVRWTSPSEFLTDKDQADLSEDALFSDDWFAHDIAYPKRLEGSEVPTAWQPLPAAPAEEAGK